MNKIISLLCTLSLIFSLSCSEYNPQHQDPYLAVVPNPQELIVNTKTQVFTVPAGNPANIVLCIDITGSMLGDQVNLWNNITDMVNRLDDYYIDYRIAVVGAGSTSPAYSGLFGRIDDINYVTPRDNNRISLIQTLLYGSGNNGEACIDSLGYAFTEHFLENEPFWRDREPLHIISVSDEYDQSRDFTAEMVSGVLDVHRLLSGAPVTYAAVVNPYESSGYATLVDLQEQNGEMVSIFDEDWEIAIDNLDYLATIVDSNYYLDELPIQDTIKVFVEDDGITFAFDNTQWIYDPIKNSVFFAEYRPKPDARVIVEYEILQ